MAVVDAPEPPEPGEQAASPHAASPAVKRRNWAVPVGVAFVVAVGSFVGILAGKITQRGPRGSGARIAVVDGGAEWSPRTPASDALSRALSATPGITVAPVAEVQARRKILSRHGPASEADVAGAIALRAWVRVSAEGGAWHAELVDGGERTSLDADGVQALAEQVAKRLSAGPVPRFVPPTDNAAAYAAFVDGDAAAAVALDPACAPCLAALKTPEALAKAKGSPRLSKKEALLVDAQLFAAAAAAEKDAAKHATDVEAAEDAYRTLTVELPEEPEGHFGLGVTFNRLIGAHDEALHHLESARRIAPTDLVVTREIAAAWMGMEDRKHALQAVRGYLALVPGDRDAEALLAELTTRPFSTATAR